jgi:phosphatidate cytidylyltransferase
LKHSWPIAGFAPVQANSSRSPREASSNKFEWREWLARASFGALLAGLAIAATFAGGFMFAIFIAVVAFAAAREWHRMVSGPRYASTIAVTTIAVAASLGWAVVARDSQWPVWLLLLGGVLAAICAFASGTRPLLNGFGTLYVGLPALSLVVLRIHVPHGAAAVLVLFIAIWAADSAALILGRVLGGPKLVPALSPNKTWAGFIAGTLFASAAVAFCINLLGGSLWQAALLGLALALAGHCGDLFESWVKRRAGRKNSGGLIPGHGGVLDRVDSTLFAAPLAALLVFVFGLDLLCGGHP